MKQLRSIASLMIVCGLLCFLIAYERYSSAITTSQAIADAIPEIELVKTRIPEATYVSGTIGVVLLVAGVICLWNYRQLQTPKTS